MVEYPESPTLISPEGILGVLFKRYPCLSFRYSDFHRAFYKAKISGLYDDILRKFRFSGSSVNPFSDELDYALANLQVAALSRKNPDMVEYSITSEFDKTYFIITQGVDENTIQKTGELCEMIESNLSAS